MGIGRRFAGSGNVTIVGLGIGGSNLYTKD